MRNKGITLIALVVTIIVLLLLAGISISMLTGDNGILTKTVTAKQATEEATELELIKLAVTAAQTAGEGRITTENLNSELKNNLKNNNVATKIKDGWVYKTKRNYIIYKDGTINEKDPIQLTIKSVEHSEIIVELMINLKEINYVHILNARTKDIIRYDDINNDIITIEFSTQVETSYYIDINSNERDYILMSKLDYTVLGNEGVIINNLPEGYYAYGANGRYYYKKLSGDCQFSNAKWGDPYGGTAKKAYSIEDIVYEKLNSPLELLNINLSIEKIENNIFNILIEGDSISRIESATVLKNEETIYTGELNDNKFRIPCQFANGETYAIEIIHFNNIKYKKVLSFTRDDAFEEQKLGNENVRVNTQGKYYYIKYGINEKWTYKWVCGENVILTNAIMGDPAPGALKETYLLDIVNMDEKNISEYT